MKVRVSSDPHSFVSDMTSPSPKDACRRSPLCGSFRSAAESDIVWDKFLPPEKHTIHSQSAESGLLAARSKKELYLALCNKPLLIDEGRLSFSLDKWSGKKCYMISARELGIVWSDDPRYWTWSSHPESRFQEVAELINVSGLEIHGKLETCWLSPSTLYKVYLVFKFTRRAYGFKRLPVEVTVGLEGEEHTSKTLFLHCEGETNYSEEETDYSEEELDFSEGESDDAEGETRDPEVPEGEPQYQRESPGWLKIEMGEFFCEGGEDGLLKMCCWAEGSPNLKSGLIVEGIEIIVSSDPHSSGTEHLKKIHGEGEGEGGGGTITCGTAMDLQQLPWYFIANVISLTSPSPKDAYRLSLLCRSFKSAAESDIVWDKFLPPESDIVWDKFLPPEIHTILSQSGESGLLANRSKKELCLALFNKPLLIYDGKLSFSLDKWSGKKCYMISARELGITWGGTPRYWRWTSHPESRFQEVAELLDVCWLEIYGKLETRLLSPSTLYKAYLVFKFTPEAYGFKHLPAEVTIGLEGEEHSKQTVFFPNEGEMNEFESEMDYSEEEMDYSEGESNDAEGEINDSRGLSEDAEGESKDAEGESDETEGESDGAKGETRDAKVPEVVFNDDRYQREDRDQRERSGWSEIELGEFFCEGGDDDGLLKMHCLANGGGHWKSGLIVQGIEVRPMKKY